MKLFVAMIVMLHGTLTLAQGSFQPGREYPLDPLSKRNFFKESKYPDMKKCGTYFLAPIWSTELPPGKVNGIYFEAVYGPNDSDHSIAVMGQDKFITEINDQQKIPTVTYVGPLGPNDPIPFHWILRISTKDYLPALPCIPPPKGGGA